MKKHFTSFLILILLLPGALFAAAAAGCGSSAAPLTKTGFYFDTVIGISLYDKKDAAALEECFSLADKYEHMLSKTLEGSDIWNINHAEGTPVEVSEDTAYLIRTALSYAELSGGKADPTIGAADGLWDFTGSGSGAPVLPSGQALQSALSHVDYRKVLVSGCTVTMQDADAEIDLGFIAKGYIADRMKEALLSHGVKSALINLGGNVLAVGSRVDGTPFRIGIQKPFADSGEYAFTLPVTDLSVVSSGSYERYFEKDGKIYHHILDTETGYPVWNNLSQVTILSSSSMAGDALSTTCFVSGLEGGMALIESLEDTEAVFITSDGTIHPSSGLTNLSLP